MIKRKTFENWPAKNICYFNKTIRAISKKKDKEFKFIFFGKSITLNVDYFSGNSL